MCSCHVPLRHQRRGFLDRAADAHVGAAAAQHAAHGFVDVLIGGLGADTFHMNQVSGIDRVMATFTTVPEAVAHVQSSAVDSEGGR